MLVSLDGHSLALLDASRVWSNDMVEIAKVKASVYSPTAPDGVVKPLGKTI